MQGWRARTCEDPQPDACAGTLVCPGRTRPRLQVADMTTHSLLRFWPVTLLGALSACAHMDDSAAEEAAARKPPITEHESVRGVAGTQPMKADRPDNVINAIAADLAKRLNVPAGQFQVVAVDAMTWNDSSLGCPQPGQFYLQALTPGFRVVLQHDGQTYEYHASEKGTYVYCRNPTRTSDGLDKE